MARTTDKSRESNTKGSITSVYEYVPIMDIDEQDALQRFGYVKVEATSFTVSEPYEALQVEPLLYTKASDDQKEILENIYEVIPFSIKAIIMERIFADKLLAAEFYYEREAFFDVAKHLYDIAIMMKLERIQNLLAEKGKLILMLSYKRAEERVRTGSDLADKPFSQFSYLKNICSDKKLEQYFMEMQKIYVFDEKDIISFSELTAEIEQLNQLLQELNEDLEMKTERGMII